MGFPTKNDHFGVFWGYHHLRKHPNNQGKGCSGFSGRDLQKCVKMHVHHLSVLNSPPPNLLMLLIFILVGHLKCQVGWEPELAKPKSVILKFEPSGFFGVKKIGLSLFKSRNLRFWIVKVEADGISLLQIEKPTPCFSDYWKKSCTTWDV